MHGSKSRQCCRSQAAVASRVVLLDVLSDKPLLWVARVLLEGFKLVSNLWTHPSACIGWLARTLRVISVFPRISMVYRPSDAP